MTNTEWNLTARVALLADVALFRNLPSETRQVVAERFHVRRFDRGRFVFLEGDPADLFNVLAAGQVKIVRETEDGREVILRIISPGEIFGGGGGWGESRYPATAIAQESSVVLQLPGAALNELIRTQGDFAIALVKELSVRLRELEARIRDLQAERVERRIARVLLRLADKTGVRTERGIEIRGPLSRQDLAELAGTTLSTASRTLSGWHQEGLVDAGRERVVILKPHALVAVADELPRRT